MENLPKEKQSAASFTLPSKKPDRLKFFLFLALGLVILVLIAEGVYWLKLNNEKESLTREASQQTGTEVFLSEEEFQTAISRIFKFKDGQVTQTIIDDLEKAKEFNPQKSEIESGMQYLRYTSAASTMIAIYYSSGDASQNRNQEMLDLIAEVRELARQNSNFKEEDWRIEGADSY